MHINFEVFGDRNTASSRLRAWMIADELDRQGHTASIGGAQDVDVAVFQKVRPYDRLRGAREQGAITVYDFDDNYLLEETGARRDIMAFMNCVDVVTVGSRELLEHAGRLHDRVYLFENPLDVLPDSKPKRGHAWEGRVGWFGARSNLSALHDVGLVQSVKTITAGGDVEWSLATIDGELKALDLVVLPVSIDAWTMAKNANRLLKCIALGVPVLASRTLEHEHVMRELGLPDWLLVDRGEDWGERIAKVGEDYEKVVESALVASGLAWQRFGVETVARDWLRAMEEKATAAPPPLGLSRWERAYFQEMDVVVGGHGDRESTLRTIQSLRLDEVSFGSVAVSASESVPELQRSEMRVIDEQTDFFETYSRESALFRECAHARVMYIRGGVELTRGFFRELPCQDDPASALFVDCLAQGEKMGQVVSGPKRLDQVIESPILPLALVMPGHVVSDGESGVREEYGALGIWEFLVRQGAADQLSFGTVVDPLLRVDSVTLASTPVTEYAAFVQRYSPELLDELPSLPDEWDRLRFVLLSAAISDNESLFAEYASTIIPRLDTRLSRAARVPVRVSPRTSRDFKRSRKWAAALNGQEVESGPELVRLPDGRVFLVEGKRRRHVPSGILLGGMEQLLGPVAEVGEGDTDSLLEGPPVVVHITDGSEEPFVVIGGVRYRTPGLPMPVEAPPDAFADFPFSDVAMDVGRGNVPRSLYAELRAGRSLPPAEVPSERTRAGAEATPLTTGTEGPPQVDARRGKSWRGAMRRLLRRSWATVEPVVPRVVRSRLRTAMRSLYRRL